MGRFLPSTDHTLLDVSEDALKNKVLVAAFTLHGVKEVGVEKSRGAAQTSAMQKRKTTLSN